MVDLATMREAIADLGGDPAKVNPLSPAEMVIDHSVVADLFGTPDAFTRNVELEYQRNRERYQFLRWGQTAFDDFVVVPPGTGIVHQVNIEHLARVVFPREVDGVLQAYPDTCVGTDSHTTMVNGLGVLGWGVGGIEAEAAMLGQPVSMLIPRVVGFKLTGALPEGATATDLVLTITEMLRKHGWSASSSSSTVPAWPTVPLANRATIGNMSPEYGSTAAIFPIDDVTLDYLRLTGRHARTVALVESYAKEQGLWHDADARDEVLRVPRTGPVDGGAVASPARSARRTASCSRRPRSGSARTCATTSNEDGRRLDEAIDETFPASDRQLIHRLNVAPRATGHGASTARSAVRPPSQVKTADGREFELDHGAVSIASITSCTNTSNPSVMLGAALLARNAVDKGLKSKPWVKTSLAPGSQGGHRLLRTSRA